MTHLDQAPSFPTQGLDWVHGLVQVTSELRQVAVTTDWQFVWLPVLGMVFLLVQAASDLQGRMDPYAHLHKLHEVGGRLPQGLLWLIGILPHCLASCFST